MRKLFLLSPAKTTGVRAGWLMNPQATFPLGRALHSTGASLVDVFTFASGLYFRGKIAYARAFGSPPTGAVRVITSNRGLCDPEEVVTPETLRAFGEVDIAADDPRYLEPLRRDALSWAARLAPDAQVILLGSVATGKYRNVLLEVFADRLYFPRDFVGRGDMSRGALLLRHARSGEELAYDRVLGATLQGRRAPRVGQP